jgi:dCMP deaminase
MSKYTYIHITHYNTMDDTYYNETPMLDVTTESIITPYDQIITVIRSSDWRPSWSEYFMVAAHFISKRSTCHRLQVGCVLVKDNRIIASGYNGNLPNTTHESIVVNGHEMMTVHAETNAVSDCANRGVATAGCTAYVTHMPCVKCAQVLLSAGIKKIVYSDDYKNDEITTKLCKSVNATIIHFNNGIEEIVC